MALKHIYFCGSIRGGRNDRAIYEKLINHLKQFGNVLTEHIASNEISAKGEGKSVMDDKQIHDRDMDWLRQSDVVVAEVTTPSLGVGYEIGQAVAMNKRILCLFRPASSNRLSAMIQGAKNETFDVYHYENIEDGCSRITKFFESL